MSTVEYITVAALEQYDELRTTDGPVTTIVVESLPDGSSYRSEVGAPPVGAGAVVLPTVLPVDASGEVVHEGDFVGQYAWCLDEAGRRLEALGLSLDHAVTTFDYSTPETRDVYRRTHRERKNRLGGAGVFPGAGGILMSRLHRPGVLVALDLTASRLPLKAVNPGWTRYDTLTYTPGVLAGDTLYMSGFAALDMETQEALFPGDSAAQSEATYAAVQEVLDEAGASADQLVHVLEYVCPDGDGPEIAAAREASVPRREGVGRRVRRAAATGVPLRGLPDGGDRVTSADRRGACARGPHRRLHRTRADGGGRRALLRARRRRPQPALLGRFLRPGAGTRGGDGAADAGLRDQPVRRAADGPRGVRRPHLGPRHPRHPTGPRRQQVHLPPPDPARGRHHGDLADHLGDVQGDRLRSARCSSSARPRRTPTRTTSCSPRTPRRIIFVGLEA